MSESSLVFISTAERRVDCLAFGGYPVNNSAFHSLRVISAGAAGTLLDLEIIGQHILVQSTA